MRTMKLDPRALAAQILDVARWPTFTGWGPIPGIREARFRTQTDAIVGSQIEVQNRDGSIHVEEIVEWRPGARIVMHMSELSPPLSRLATHLIETWDFEPPAAPLLSEPSQVPVTRVTRSFAMHPTGAAARLALLPIAAMLRRAVERHLDQIDQA